MKQIFLLLSLITSLNLSAQKIIHDANATTRNAKVFHAIDIQDGIDLYLTQGNEEAVAVSASTEEYRDKIKVEVSDGVLKIYFEKQGNWGISWGNRKLKAYVSVKNIDKLHASGGADVYIENELNANILSMHFSGGSDLRGKIIANDLSISASGGSDAYLSGKANHLKIQASGGSDIHGFEMMTEYCAVESSGGSDIRISANKELITNASGGSDVYYKGNASATTNKGGGSTIKKVN